MTAGVPNLDGASVAPNKCLVIRSSVAGEYLQVLNISGTGAIEVHQCDGTPSGAEIPTGTTYDTIIFEHPTATGASKQEWLSGYNDFLYVKNVSGGSIYISYQVETIT